VVQQVKDRLGLLLQTKELVSDTIAGENLDGVGGHRHGSEGSEVDGCTRYIAESVSQSDSSNVVEGDDNLHGTVGLVGERRETEVTRGNKEVTRVGGQTVDDARSELSKKRFWDLVKTPSGGGFVGEANSLRNSGGQVSYFGTERTGLEAAGCLGLNNSSSVGVVGDLVLYLLLDLGRLLVNLSVFSGGIEEVVCGRFGYGQGAGQGGLHFV